MFAKLVRWKTTKKWFNCPAAQFTTGNTAKTIAKLY